MKVFGLLFNHKGKTSEKPGTPDEKNHAEKPIIYHTSSGRQFISAKDLLNIKSVREEIKSLAKLDK